MFWQKNYQKKNVIHNKFISHKHKHNVHFNIGSTLQWAGSNSIIWGSGFISDDSLLNPEVETRNIYAVRGPLTLKKINNHNNDIALGDPAVLLPLIYKPNVNKKYKIGIIPHYKDKNSDWIKINKNLTGVRLINIECGINWKSFINDILECEIIISSSLHGLIMADCYKIPSVWISLSQEINGGNFKFLDYYYSQNNFNPLHRDIKIGDKIFDIIKEARLNQDIIDKEKLLKSCPFISEEVKHNLLCKINQNEKYIS